MTTPLRDLSILLAPASGPGVGGGHVIRCLTLAEALAARGCECRFAVTSAGEDLIARFRPDCFPILRLDPPDGLAQAVAQAGCDGLVVDNYALDAEAEARLGQAVRRVMVIDDLADRRHMADLVLDPGYGRTPDAYVRLAPGAVVLAGPDYALVRPAFRERRPASAGCRDKALRIMVSFGLADPGEIARRAVVLLLAHAPEAVLDVVLASDAPSRPALARLAAQDHRVQLHLDVADVAAIMARCDLCVGAGGSSVWERAVVGLPSLVVVVADNQRDLARQLSSDGYCAMADLADADFEAQFSAALEGLKPPHVRLTMADAAMALCDGLGAERAADAFVTLLRT